MNEMKSTGRVRHRAPHGNKKLVGGAERTLGGYGGAFRRAGELPERGRGAMAAGKKKPL